MQTTYDCGLEPHTEEHLQKCTQPDLAHYSNIAKECVQKWRKDVSKQSHKILTEKRRNKTLQRKRNKNCSKRKCIKRSIAIKRYTTATLLTCSYTTDRAGGRINRTHNSYSWKIFYQTIFLYQLFYHSLILQYLERLCVQNMIRAVKEGLQGQIQFCDKLIFHFPYERGEQFTSLQPHVETVVFSTLPKQTFVKKQQQPFTDVTFQVYSSINFFTGICFCSFLGLAIINQSNIEFNIQTEAKISLRNVHVGPICC